MPPRWRAPSSRDIPAAPGGLSFGVIYMLSRLWGWCTLASDYPARRFNFVVKTCAASPCSFDYTPHQNQKLFKDPLHPSPIATFGEPSGNIPEGYAKRWENVPGGSSAGFIAKPHGTGCTPSPPHGPSRGTTLRMDRRSLLGTDLRRDPPPPGPRTVSIAMASHPWPSGSDRTAPGSGL